ncbi:MAG: ferritin-like domain-containing protein [Myxococcota bacterium]|nr:ferritin-like domain-containing protein [Myxococcota bacterium]
MSGADAAVAAAPSLSGISPVEREILVYSYYRDAELRGANLLFRLMRKVEDPESQVMLTEHLADEVRHAWLWTERIRELGGYPLPVTDGYQVRIGKRAGVPRKIVDLFALTVVVEQRALRRYHEHLKRQDIPERTREVLEAVSKDEGWHIDWIRKKAREFAAEAGDPDWMDRAVARYREIDREVMEELETYERQVMGLA